MTAGKVGIAGLDEQLRARQCHSALGIVSDGRGNRMTAARYGLAGLDRPSKATALCGVAGVNTRPTLREDAVSHASFGVAGVKDATTLRAAHGACGVAGNLGSTVRAELPDLLRPPHSPQRQRLGDRAAEVAHQYGVYFADYTYVVCTDDRGVGEILRWRQGREDVFGVGQRMLPLFLDSSAYRIWTGTAPRWASFDTYLAAIEMIQPDGFAAFDEIGNQGASVKNFDLMTAMGYGPDRGCFPIYHVRPKWRDDATVTGLPWRSIPAAARCAVANARIAAADPVMKYYAAQSRLIGLGGMVRGPIPRDFRHYYIAELCRAYPDHQFWCLGQANFKVVNGLGALGLLDRCWTDGSWWILDAACERFAVVMDGQIRMHSLEGIAASLFTITECMAANLRSLLAAYAGLWEWPPPDPLPLDQHDPDEAEELYDRVHQARLDLFGDEQVRMCGNVPVRVLRDTDVS
ncbi:MAG: hypothetical protein KKA73_07905 [Chloroflexi bacterium]|nr:hypothetical protein [Chloroflexota bacterium]MBU1747597.1 hypothetical protein [Chloroflexota bacterium]